MAARYYVYLHIKLDIGEPFYIGKGTGKSQSEIAKYFNSTQGTISDVIKKHIRKEVNLG